MVSFDEVFKPFKETDHYYRPASVIIRKPLVPEFAKRRLLEETIIEYTINKGIKPSDSVISSLKTAYLGKLDLYYSDLKICYDEFISNKLLQEFNSTMYGASTGTTNAELTRYYSQFNGFYLATNYSNRSNFIQGKSTFVSSGSSLSDGLAQCEDVISCRIDAQVNGETTASILIKNENDKYSYSEAPTMGKFIDKIGECIIEPNDEIWVFLPDTNGMLHCKFSGFVNKVAKVDNAGFHSILLNCECAHKSLRLTRTNLQPSANKSESGRADVQAFQLPEGFYNKPLESMLMIVSQTMTNLYSELAISDKLSDNPIINYYYYVNNPVVDELNPSIAGLDSSSITNPWLMKAFSKYASTIIYDGNTTTSYEGAKFDNNVQDGLSNGKSVVFTLYREQSDIKYSDKVDKNNLIMSNVRLPAAVVAGTNQLLFQYDVGGAPDLFNSNWKSNKDVIMNFVNMFNFVCYTDPGSRCLIIAPPNLSIFYTDVGTSITSSGTTSESLLKISTNKIQKNTRTVKCPYYFEKDSNHLISITSSRDDALLFNWAPVCGQWTDVVKGETISSYNKIIIFLKNLYDKYGFRMKKEEVYPNVKDNATLYVYALGLLERQNHNFYSCSANIVGDSRISVNNCFYVEKQKTLYYIESATYEYTAGGSFKVSVKGSLGRKPLFSYSSILSSLVVNKNKTLNAIKVLEEGNAISPVVANIYKFDIPKLSDADFASYIDQKTIDGYIFSELASNLYVEAVRNTSIFYGLSKVEYALNNTLSIVNGSLTQDQKANKLYSVLNDKTNSFKYLVPNEICFFKKPFIQTSDIVSAKKQDQTVESYLYKYQEFVETPFFNRTYSIGSAKIRVSPEALFSFSYLLTSKFGDSFDVLKLPDSTAAGCFASTNNLFLSNKYLFEMLYEVGGSSRAMSSLIMANDSGFLFFTSSAKLSNTYSSLGISDKKFIANSSDNKYCINRIKTGNTGSLTDLYGSLYYSMMSETSSSMYVRYKNSSVSLDYTSMTDGDTAFFNDITDNKLPYGKMILQLNSDITVNNLAIILNKIKNLTQ